LLIKDNSILNIRFTNNEMKGGDVRGVGEEAAELRCPPERVAGATDRGDREVATLVRSLEIAVQSPVPRRPATGEFAELSGLQFYFPTGSLSAR